MAKKTPSDADYDIGRGRPPQQSRWKPGQSGNPNGRPKGRLNQRTLLRRLLLETVVIREGERLRKVTKFEAVHLTQVLKAMKGDTKAFKAIVDFVKDDPAALEPPPVLNLVFGHERDFPG